MSSRVEEALFLSDLHLGWVPLVPIHRRLLAQLERAAGDASLVVLNGDIVDGYRGQPSDGTREVVERFCERVQAWRDEGREVVVIEGNHDPAGTTPAPLSAERWRYDFTGSRGERVRVLHGHRFSDEVEPLGVYEGFGRHFLRFENHAYGASGLLRWMYPWSIGWVVGAVGRVEDIVWRRSILEAIGRMDDVDVVVHGHLHFGPGSIRAGRVILFRSGAWVSAGHRGCVDRILRYRRGDFERLALDGGGFVVTRDGR